MRNDNSVNQSGTPSFVCRSFLFLFVGVFLLLLRLSRYRATIRDLAVAVVIIISTRLVLTHRRTQEREKKPRYVKKKRAVKDEREIDRRVKLSVSNPICPMAIVETTDNRAFYSGRTRARATPSSSSSPKNSSVCFSPSVIRKIND